MISLLFIIDFPDYYPCCRFILLGDRDDGNFITECLLDVVYILSPQILEICFLKHEIERIKNEAGSNYFVLSLLKWIDTSNAVGIISNSGRYGGTYAHKDITFEFASWIRKLILPKQKNGILPSKGYILSNFTNERIAFTVCFQQY